MSTNNRKANKIMATTAINTKYGTFGVTDNGKGGTILSYNGHKICGFEKIAWWNKDAIENAIKANRKEIKERILKVKSSGVKVTEQNIVEVLEDARTLLGDRNNGYFSRRLTEILEHLGTSNTNGLYE